MLFSFKIHPFGFQLKCLVCTKLLAIILLKLYKWSRIKHSTLHKSILFMKNYLEETVETCPFICIPYRVRMCHSYLNIELLRRRIFLKLRIKLVCIFVLNSNLPNTLLYKFQYGDSQNHEPWTFWRENEKMYNEDSGKSCQEFNLFAKLYSIW